MVKIDDIIKKLRDKNFMHLGNKNCTRDDKLNENKIKDYNAKEFYNKSDIEEWAKNTFKKLTITEEKNLYAYTNSESINKEIRMGEKLSSCNEKTDMYLSKIIDENIIKESIVVYRGIIKEAYECMKKAYKDKYPYSVDNNKLLEKAYMSTSMLKEKIIHSDYQLRIVVPKGTHAIYIGNISYSPSQVELLLGKNTVLEIIKYTDKYIYAIVCN